MADSESCGNTIFTGKDFHDKFDTSVYLKVTYGNGHRGDFVYHSLQCYHDAFQSLPSDLRILDYGSGPSFLTTISCATKASEIVLSDYTEGNRKALRQWLARDPNAFDWSALFRYVVIGLEGNTESEVVERQEHVRKLVKAVVHCDLTQEPPIESGYDQQYDVVIVNLCIAGASRTQVDYHRGVAKLGKLVKSGGVLMIYDAERHGNGTGYYYVGETKFRNVSVSSEFVSEAMRDSGFSDISVRKCAMSSLDPQIVGFMFLKGKKGTDVIASTASN